MNESRPVDTERETNEVTYLVLDMDSDHAETTVSERLLTNSGVGAVVVDLERRRVSRSTVKDSTWRPSEP